MSRITKDWVQVLLKKLNDPDLSYKPGVQVIQSFVPCKHNLVSAQEKYFSCQTLAEMGDHMMTGILQIPTVRSAMDLVKKSFFMIIIETANSYKSLASTLSKILCVNVIIIYQWNQHFTLRITKNLSNSNYSWIVKILVAK